MAKKQYLQVSCEDVGPGCAAMFRVATEGELWEVGRLHARTVHGIQGELPPELVERVKAATKTIEVEVSEG